MRAGYELRVGDIVLHAVVRDGKVNVAGGALAAPDLLIESGPGIKAVMAGELTPAQAIAAGLVTLRGPRKLFERFAQIFHIDALTAA